MALAVLIAVVVLAPLPFGAVDQISYSAAALAVGLIGVAAALQLLRGRLEPHSLWPASIPFAFACAWIVLQTTSFFPALQHPLWDDAARALRSPLVGAISLDPAGSLTALMRGAEHLRSA